MRRTALLACGACFAALHSCILAFVREAPPLRRSPDVRERRRRAHRERSEVARSAPAERLTYRRRRILFSAIASGETEAKAGAHTALPELTQAEVRRYSRHLILPDVGVEGQRRLKAAKVLCVGAGGLGSPALLYLAAAGVGTLGIIDDDVVDESNLQRQVIHGESTLGRSKVLSAGARVLEMNPHVQTRTVQAQLTSTNALDVLRGYDVVLDGSDNFPTKYLVNDACAILGIPCVYGAILGFEGQVSVFNYKGGPDYRDLMPTPPPAGEVPSCAEGGVLGILPGVIGCIQATEVIKLILGKGDVLSGRLLLYDALRMTFRETALRPRQGAAPVTALVDYEGFCGFAAAAPPAAGPPSGAAAAAVAALVAGKQTAADNEPEAVGADADAGGATFERISVGEVWKRLKGGWTPFVLDVRLPEEAVIASLPFADLLCPHREVASVADQLPRDGDILVHCKVGGRSAKACEALAAAGFGGRLYNLEGGIAAWAREIDPSLPLY